jgi:GH43 family beta-xylosidase
MTLPKNALIIATSLLLSLSGLAQAQPAATAPQANANTFTNPIAVAADPFIVKHGDAYYWCLSENDLGVAICKSDTPASLGTRHVVWRSPETGPHAKEIWAPELFLLDGRWYIYVAASDGNNATHRMIVLESETDDPLSKYTFKAELYTGDNIDTKKDNRWAIDGTVLTHRGKRYFIWSGWHDDRDRQWLYAAPMSNPWTVSGNRVRICENNDYLWERVDENRRGRGLNEGPQILERGKRVFIIYSASGSWQTSYKMGLLELVGDNPLAPGAWRKHPEPVFSPTEKTWGVGHGTFTKSPDGTEDWMVYHAKLTQEKGWYRGIFAQPFTWTDDDFPNLGTPVAPGKPIPLPSGSKVRTAEK